MPEGVKLSGIWLRGDGRDIVVEVEFANDRGKFVEVIREFSGHDEVAIISHHVSALGIAGAREANDDERLMRSPRR